MLPVPRIIRVLYRVGPGDFRAGLARLVGPARGRGPARVRGPSSKYNLGISERGERREV
jgi:hypothetical protein